jgi:hypothetical protein
MLASDEQYSGHCGASPLSPACRTLENGATVERSALCALADCNRRDSPIAAAWPGGGHLRWPCVVRRRAIPHDQGSDPRTARGIHHNPEHRRVLRTQPQNVRQVACYGAKRRVFLFARRRKRSGCFRRAHTLSSALFSGSNELPVRSRWDRPVSQQKASDKPQCPFPCELSRTRGTSMAKCTRNPGALFNRALLPLHSASWPSTGGRYPSSPLAVAGCRSGDQHQRTSCSTRNRITQPSAHPVLCKETGSLHLVSARRSVTPSAVFASYNGQRCSNGGP